MATETLTLPMPTVTPAGKAKLDALIKEVIDKGDIPVVFWAATNAKETIYENQEGYMVYGDETSGKVKPDTSTFT
jgi:methyl acetate hydrolase